MKKAVASCPSLKEGGELFGRVNSLRVMAIIDCHDDDLGSSGIEEHQINKLGYASVNQANQRWIRLLDKLCFAPEVKLRDRKLG